MAASGEKSFYVLEYHSNKSVVTVQSALGANSQRTRLQTRLFVRGINNLLKLSVIDVPILTRVWQELENCIDVCRVTRCAHIEHL